MKRLLFYIAVLGAALLVPLRGTDVGKLQPVGLVQLYKEENMVFVVTDTGDSGCGSTVDEAFKNLEDTTSGVVFLDTADFLLVSKNAIREIGELERYLKKSVRVCFAEADIDTTEAAEYLNVHRPSVQLREGSGILNAQTLRKENGRLIMGR